MPLRNCDYAACVAAAERELGSCMLCSSHRCSEHLKSAYHRCPERNSKPDEYWAAYAKADDECLDDLLRKVHIPALISLAESLRPGYNCSIPAFDAGLTPDERRKIVKSQMGGQNCHLDIQFSDGIVWLVRIRLETPRMPPKSVNDFVLASEVATMQFLADFSTVPIPQVFYHSVDPQKSGLGVSLIMMEKMAGHPCPWKSATAAQKTKVMEQLADIFLEIERHPLPALGSLKSGLVVGGNASGRLFSTPSNAFGPFTDTETMFKRLFIQEMAFIQDGELITNAVNTYLTQLWRLEQVSGMSVPNNTNGPFYLKHNDDKGDHILVDDDFNITAIIDWEFAAAEPKLFALSSPCMMWPVGDFYDGKNNLAPEELEFADMFASRGRQDLKQLVLHGRKHQRYRFFLGGSTDDQQEFGSPFQGPRTAVVGSDNVVFDEWRTNALCK